MHACSESSFGKSFLLLFIALSSFSRERGGAGNLDKMTHCISSEMIIKSFIKN